MKSVLLMFIVFSFQFIQAADKKMSCRFPPWSQGMELMENCVQSGKNGSLKIVPSILAKITFDSRGLAEGSIVDKGCFWLNKKGLLRKTHCFDNGADYFEDGYSRYIDQNGKFGFMNERLEIKIPPRYTFAFPFASGHAKVCMDCTSVKKENSEYSSLVGGKWSIIDKKGKIVKNCLEASKVHECNVNSK